MQNLFAWFPCNKCHIFNYNKLWTNQKKKILPKTCDTIKFLIRWPMNLIIWPLNQIKMTFEPTTRSWLSQPPAWPVVSCRPAHPLRTWLPGVCRVGSQGRAGTQAQANTAGPKSAPSVNKSQSVTSCILEPLWFITKRKLKYSHFQIMH